MRCMPIGAVTVAQRGLCARYSDGAAVAGRTQNFLRTCTGKHRTKWMQLKESLMREAELVQELDREVAAFRENAGARRSKQGGGGPGYESRKLRPQGGEHGDPFGGRAKPDPPDDPDVWPPPTPRERSPAQPRKRQGGRDLPSWARREARDARAK